MIDKYYSKQYNSKTYNCAHLVCEFWKELTNQDISVHLAGFLTGPNERRAVLAQLRVFKRLNAPVSPCIVLFQAHREAPHVGIYINDRVLHISSKQGVRFDTLGGVSVGYNKIGFFVC